MEETDKSFRVRSTGAAGPRRFSFGPKLLLPISDLVEQGERRTLRQIQFAKLIHDRVIDGFEECQLDFPAGFGRRLLGKKRSG